MTTPIDFTPGSTVAVDMGRDLFVTGTDTGAGKTHVAVALLGALRARGQRASGMKPVASGCMRTAEGLRNEDALALIAASDPAPAYATCNPYAFEPPIAPHLAAHAVARRIELAPIRTAFEQLRARAGRVVVEGVGGWMAPLSDGLMQADLVRDLDLDVVLVVGLRLGCLNHALLSARAIAGDGCRLAGWIANHIDPAMAAVDDNIATLRARIDAPLLGQLAYGGTGFVAIDAAAP
ncbi:dethiobiotin synthetase [Dokdonella fugitiva]|jgi:dethiobiotin synthetase|uniref:ATP-dependent dethiobiotin synthetase BioD n=2 Tax=Dokdonella fugitiva TaxID=328517 RepID=A0A4V2S2Q0_9GAMM|nr:dethiobiotin synthetase [Dokdonella fugitiva]TCO41270.1 dethiobiotin synthetase [Dokdonella fugitiva]